MDGIHTDIYSKFKQLLATTATFALKKKWRIYFEKA